MSKLATRSRSVYKQAPLPNFDAPLPLGIRGLWPSEEEVRQVLQASQNQAGFTLDEHVNRYDLTVPTGRVVIIKNSRLCRVLASVAFCFNCPGGVEGGKNTQLAAFANTRAALNGSAGIAYGGARLLCYGESRALVLGDATAAAFSGSKVIAWRGATVTAFAGSYVWAGPGSTVDALAGSCVRASYGSTVIARGGTIQYSGVRVLEETLKNMFRSLRACVIPMPGQASSICLPEAC